MAEREPFYADDFRQNTQSTEVPLNKSGFVESDSGFHSDSDRVQSLLSGIEGVLEVVEHAHPLKVDVNEKDLEVFFGDDSVYNELRSVNVQIKVSKEEERCFRRTLKRRHGMDNEELKKHLMEEKLVLLRSRKDDESIVWEFNRQVREILDYHVSEED